MPENPTAGTGRVTPYLTYADAPAAIEFLSKAFGFEERYRIPMQDGRVGHAEVTRGDAVIFLASAYPELGLASPRDLPGIHSQVHLYVDDVDAHFARAKAAGATIATEPTDQFYGDRVYNAIDPEGHRWMIAQHVRDVSPEEMQKAAEG